MSHDQLNPDRALAMHVLQCGGQLPIKELSAYITFMYFQPKNQPERFHLVKVLPIYITLLWFLGSEGFSDAHECLLHSPRWEHGYLCEFLHTPQKYEAFSTFFTLTGCFSAFIFGGFVVMWFSSGGRCLHYVSAHVRLIWLILRVFFGTQGRMAYSLA